MRIALLLLLALSAAGCARWKPVAIETKEAVRGTAQEIGAGAKEVGQAVGEGAKEVGHAVSDTAKKIFKPKR